ncbi:MAG: tandem-95 repeat protein, partial [Bifidobacteriaceae bacterium]|nr:tandem-95 repeat protein [Bifidobacteriaceae bacterium]
MKHAPTAWPAQRAGRFRLSAPQVRRWLGGGLVAAMVAALGVVAYLQPGFAEASANLNDAGVWVTNPNRTKLGRVNTAAETIDANLTALNSSFDLVQEGNQVVLYNQGDHRLSTIDTVNVTLGEGGVEVPSDAQVLLGGGRLAVFSPALGAIWAVAVTQVGALNLEEDPLVDGLPATAAVTVGVEGTIHVANPASQSLTSYPLDRAATTTELKGLAASATPDVTAVGSQAVVLDPAKGTVYLPGGAAIIPNGMTGQPGAQLQQPSQATGVVLIQTATRLVTQPLDGTKASPWDNNLGGTVTRPVQVAGCSFAVWGTTGQVFRDCPGLDNDLPERVPDIDDNDQLIWRVNRDRVALNIIPEGRIYLAMGDFTESVDWSTEEPENGEGEESDQSNKRNSKQDQPEQTEQEPPTAVDDTFGVRAGSATLLNVTKNDDDVNGDLLTVSLVGGQPAIGTVQVVQGGRAFQIDVPSGATGSGTFRYEVADGHGGTDQATVTVTVRPDSVNSPPEAWLHQVEVPVGSGAQGEYDVLADWYDPDGDEVYLADAHLEGTDVGDSVHFRSDGVVTFQDTGSAKGIKTVVVTVSDGRSTNEGTIAFRVEEKGTFPPQANSDHAAGLVGQDVTVNLLTNDTDPDGGELRLTAVGEYSDLTMSEPSEDGQVTFRASQPLTAYLPYTVTNGSRTANAWVRVDISAPPANAAGLPPAAIADKALLPVGESTLVNVLWNDSDPSGGQLVLTGATSGDPTKVAVSVLEHMTLQVNDLAGGFDQPVTVTYTVANQNGTSQGRVTVLSVAPPPNRQPPVVLKDKATVRAGDIVTVYPLENDYHPNGLPFELVADSATLQDASPGGLVFTSGDTVRFHAPDQAGLVRVNYAVTDNQNDPVTGVIEIQVVALDAASNRAPEPPSLTGATVAGGSARISVVLDGADPDGDYTVWLGVGTPPALGSVEYDRGVLTYTAQARPDHYGTDRFTYLVQDRWGAQGEGMVEVGVAAPATMNHPPVAVDAQVYVRPGRLVGVSPNIYCSDPDGDPIELVSAGPVSAELTQVEADPATGWVTLRAPEQEGFYAATYVVADSYGAQATGSITVRVGADAPLLAPQPQDDLVSLEEALKAAASVGTVEVDARANDIDPDGVIADATLTVDLPGVAVGGGLVSVPVTDDWQVIDYQLTDIDGLVGHGFIVVPGVATAAPSLDTAAFDPTAGGLQVQAGQTVQIALPDYVTVRPGRTPRVASNQVSVQRGSGRVLDETTLEYTAPATSGTDAVAVSVVDAPGLNDQGALTAVVTIPIQVLPSPEEAAAAEELAQAEAATLSVSLLGAELQVEPGNSTSLDLARYASASMDGTQFEYSLSTDAGMGGLSASLAGSVLTVQADAGLAPGSVELDVTATGSNPAAAEPALAGATVVVTVVATTRPAPRAVDDQAEAVNQGEARTVQVLDNDQNFFPETPLKVTAASLVSGDAKVSFDTASVTITPDGAFHGTVTAAYTIQDAAAREATALVTVTVLGVPDPVGGVKVDEVADGLVRLSWDVPANNGAPIEQYIVAAVGTGGKTWTTTDNFCSLTGLTNNVEYTFTVTAENSVGRSDASVPSAPARPDKLPEQPQAPTLTWGDGQVTVTWPATPSGGSPVTAYDLQIDPAPTAGEPSKTDVTGTSIGWTGLANGTPYRVRVCAKNLVADCTLPEQWGPWSASVIPAGAPWATGSPSVTRLGQVGNASQFQVTWPAFEANGDPIIGYEVTAYRGGAVVNSASGLTTTSWTAEFATSEVGYTFAVRATNKAGTSDWSPQSAALRSVVTPGAVGDLKVADGDGQGTVSFQSGALGGASVAEVAFYYSLSGGAAQPISSPSVIGGLVNNTCYTVDVWAATTVDGNTYESPKTRWEKLCPYGAPFAPSVTSWVSADSMSFSW